jgi:hypothetical protein
VARHGLVKYEPHKLRNYSRDGACEACGLPPAGKRSLVLDHRHPHEWIRGLVCNYCNHLLHRLDHGLPVGSSFPSRLEDLRRNCPVCRMVIDECRIDIAQRSYILYDVRVTHLATGLMAEASGVSADVQWNAIRDLLEKLPPVPR